MFWLVKFRLPSNLDAWLTCVVYNLMDDEDASRAFRLRYPSAVNVTAKLMTGTVVDGLALIRQADAADKAAIESGKRDWAKPESVANPIPPGER